MATASGGESALLDLDSEFTADFREIFRRESQNLGQRVEAFHPETPDEAALMRAIDITVREMWKLLVAHEVPLIQFATEVEAKAFLRVLRPVTDAWSASTNSSFAEQAEAFLVVVDQWLPELLARAERSREPGVAAFWAQPEKRIEVVTDSIRTGLRRADALRIGEIRGEAEAALSRIATTESSTAQIEEHRKEAVGSEAASSLAEHFDTHGRDQARTMWLLRVVGALFLTFAFLIARDFVLSVENPLSWDQEIARLGLTLPVLFLAYYALREASHHRDAAQSARENAVRLKTIKAYADAVDIEQRRELFLTLGLRVFGPSPPWPVDQAIDAGQAAGAISALSSAIGAIPKR